MSVSVRTRAETNPAKLLNMTAGDDARLGAAPGNLCLHPPVAGKTGDARRLAILARAQQIFSVRRRASQRHKVRARARPNPRAGGLVRALDLPLSPCLLLAG